MIKMTMTLTQLAKAVAKDLNGQSVSNRNHQNRGVFAFNEESPSKRSLPTRKNPKTGVYEFYDSSTGTWIALLGIAAVIFYLWYTQGGSSGGGGGGGSTSSGISGPTIGGSSGSSGINTDTGAGPNGLPSGLVGSPLTSPPLSSPADLYGVNASILNSAPTGLASVTSIQPGVARLTTTRYTPPSSSTQNMGNPFTISTYVPLGSQAIQKNPTITIANKGSTRTLTAL
jgi:hypothetical protein